MHLRTASGSCKPWKGLPDLHLIYKCHDTQKYEGILHMFKHVIYMYILSYDIVICIYISIYLAFTIQTAGFLLQE